LLLSRTYHIIQLYIALKASSKYISSINALGISLSFMPMYIHIVQDTVAIAQPTHCVLGSAFESM